MIGGNMAIKEDLLTYKKNRAVAQPALRWHSLMQRHARAWMSCVLAFSDVAVLLAVFLTAMSLRMGDFDSLDQYLYLNYFWVPVLLLLIIYAENGLYPGIGLSAVEEVRRLSLSTGLVFLIVVTITFLLKTTAVYSRLVFGLAWAAATILVPLVRNLVRRLCVRFNIWGEPVAIVGFPDRRVIEVADFFAKYRTKGILPKAVFVEDANQFKGDIGYRVIDSEDINGWPDRFGIKTVLVVVPNWNWIGDNIDKYRYTFERVVLIRQQKDTFSLSDSKTLDFNQVIGFQVCHNLLNPLSMVVKRCEDILIAGLCLLFLSPVLALINLLIHFDSPGGIYYRQDRLGKGGKVIKVLKFRTMYTNGDQILEERLRNYPALREEWEKYQKLKCDPRMTRVGAILRKFSLDELPQIRNILKGEMSLVGPRPILTSQKEMYGPAFHDYCQIKPGITGLWQVSGRNHTTFARRAELDMEYIQRWSLWLDIYIIFQTVKEVLSRDGAY
jgi:Undecaprenyl-phosphate galactose phosphotransferase WbaP